MELTQRSSDCTRDIYAETMIKRHGQQIGYLAMYGVQYPLKYGHNRIGRDPQLCSIVLNFDSVSRQHAIISIFNHKKYTLMDLASANGTRIMEESLITLKPHMPVPLKNGAIVQLGEDIVGVFNIFEEKEDDAELPATQVEIPYTPKRFKFNGPTTVIPESPDVSDRDESFIIASQQDKMIPLKNNSHFVRPSSKTISIHPVGTNRIDNIYWNSSKKSTSLRLSSNNSSLNTSVLPPPERKNDDIYEMETQALFCEQNDPSGTIYSAETQPHNNPTLNTSPLLLPQIENHDIHEMETQAPYPQRNEPVVSMPSQSASLSMLSLDAQTNLPKIQKVGNPQKMQLEFNVSDKENDDSIFNAETQLINDKEPLHMESGFNDDSKLSNLKGSEKSKNLVITSDDSLTDCEDEVIFPTQQVFEKNNDDLIDGEEEPAPKSSNFRITENIEDMSTQVLECNPTGNTNIGTAFEDMLTQVLYENNTNQTEDSSVTLNEYSEEIISPFKVPLQCRVPIRVKKNTPKAKEVTLKDDQYYKLTQDIYNDLCSQKQQSPETVNEESVQNIDDDMLLCSQENYVVGNKFPHIEAQLTPPKGNKSSSSNGENEVNAFVSSLSKQEIHNMIGVQVEKMKVESSDGSDVDVTPKKSKPIRFNDLELPSSQDIKACVSLLPQTKTDTSSESETECSEDQNTPVLFRLKKKPKLDERKDISKSFHIDGLPSRIMVRNRKATAKLLETCEDQTDGVDKQIINENITRLKNKSEKKKDTKAKDITEQKSKTRNRDNCDKNQKNTNNANNKQLNVNTCVATDNSDKVNKNKINNKAKGNDIIHKKANNKMEVGNLEVENEPENSTKRTRSTRQKKQNIEQKPESVSLNNNNTIRRSERHRRETKRYITSEEKEIELRRSKREKTAKEKEQGKKTTSTSKKTDQSTVYNVTSELNTRSSKSVKRSIDKDCEPPSSKRSRIVCPVISTRLAPARGVKTQYVLFTAFPSLDVQHKMEKLGAKVVTDVRKCTVVLTMQIKRTFKLLCAVGLGKPIVGPNWVQACVDTNMIIDPWLYLIKDEAAEKKFHFSLEHTLKGSRNFLKGYNISATPEVTPPTSEMKLIVECSGGTWKEGGPRWICISCKADMELWPVMKKRGAALVTIEFLLGGVLRQRLDIAGNALN